MFQKYDLVKIRTKVGHTDKLSLQLKSVHIFMTEKQKQRTVPLSLRWLCSAKH